MNTNFVGRGAYTRLKQIHFKEFMSAHIAITKAVLKRNSWVCNKYLYIDMCAGDSGNNATGDGSPVIASNLLSAAEIDSERIFIEKTPKTFALLKNKMQGDTAQFINGDHNEVLPEKNIKHPIFGILYYDPNGDPFVGNRSLVSDFYGKKNTEKIDFLAYLSLTTIKRVKMSPLTRRKWGLIEDIEAIGKKHWLIREPAGKQQWTFIFGTNWVEFPKFKKIGFHGIDSPVGQRILLNGNYTKSEISEKNIFIPTVQEQKDLFPNYAVGVF